jgi:hypothetical protein
MHRMWHVDAENASKIQPISPKLVSGKYYAYDCVCVGGEGGVLSTGTWCTAGSVALTARPAAFLPAVQHDTSRVWGTPVHTALVLNWPMLHRVE